MLFYVLIFTAIFVLSALLLSLIGMGAADEKKQAEQRLQALMGERKSRAPELSDFRKVESYSSIPLLNRVLLDVDIAAKLRDLLSQAKVDWTPARLLLMCTVCAVIPGYFAYMRTNVLLVSLLISAALGSIPVIYVLIRRARRFDLFEQGMPAALDLMVSGLRAGHSLVSSINLVARESPEPIGPEFRICFDEQNYGVDLRTAMENLSKRVPIQALRIVLTAILIQKETGGNLAEVLDRCSQVIRERFRLKKEIRVKTAQGRLTGWILSLLPVILGMLIYLMNPAHVRLLWTNSMGQKMLYGASAMTLIGALIIRKIVRIRV